FFSVTGTGPCGPASSKSQTCVSVVTNTACIQVAKVCGPQTVQFAAGSYQISGTVTNFGTAPLTAVTIWDVVTNPPGHSVTNVVSSGGTLAAGASATVGPITIPVSLCGPYTDYLLVSGTGPCGSITSRSPQTCTTTVECPVPCIKVSKAVACAPISGIAGCDGSLSYGPTATGVAGTNNPAFCYQMTVTNCGSDVLTGVAVVDNLIPQVAGAFPTTLNPGDSVTHYFGQSYGVGNHVNTVTASGSGQNSTSNVTAHASAT